MRATESAHEKANEPRKLIGCDALFSVGLPRRVNGGPEIIEKRRQMRKVAVLAAFAPDSRLDVFATASEQRQGRMISISLVGNADQKLMAGTERPRPGDENESVSAKVDPLLFPVFIPDQGISGRAAAKFRIAAGGNGLGFAGNFSSLASEGGGGVADFVGSGHGILGLVGASLPADRNKLPNRLGYARKICKNRKLFSENDEMRDRHLKQPPPEEGNTQ